MKELDTLKARTSVLANLRDGLELSLSERAATRQKLTDDHTAEAASFDSETEAKTARLNEVRSDHKILEDAVAACELIVNPPAVATEPSPE